jgi:serine/threonine protein kinase
MLDSFSLINQEWAIDLVHERGPIKICQCINKGSNERAVAGLFHAEDDGMSVAERQRRFQIVDLNRVLGLHPYLFYDESASGDLVIGHKNHSFKTLGQYLKEGWYFEEREVYEISLQVLTALEAIHARSSVHGRLILDNILYDHNSGLISLVGFLHVYEGLLWGGEERRLERYLPPEFFMFNEYTYASEIYLVGLMILELISGERWLANIKDEVVTSYRVKRDYDIFDLIPNGISSSLQSILSMALAVDPADRFADMGQMRRAFINAPTVIKALGDRSPRILSLSLTSSNGVDESFRQDQSDSVTNIQNKVTEEIKRSPAVSSSIVLKTQTKEEEVQGISWQRITYITLTIGLLIFAMY